jgi:integrase
MLLSVAVERWINLREATGEWSPDTARNGRYVWRRYSGMLGDRDLRKIDAGDIEDLFLDARALSPEWSNCRRAFVRGLFSWALRRGFIRRDPTVDTWPRLAETGETIFRTLSRTEERALCRQLWPAMVRYVVVAIATGLRRGTLYALDWSMVTADWILSIPAGVIKNRRAIRIPINRRAIRALGRRREAGRLLPGLPTKSKLNLRLLHAAQRAGLSRVEDLTSHQMRRTWVERFRDAGGTAEECMLVQGWSSRNVLISRYWPRCPESRAREILERI